MSHSHASKSHTPFLTKIWAREKKWRCWASSWGEDHYRRSTTIRTRMGKRVLNKLSKFSFEHIFLRPRFKKNLPVRWALVVSHWCSKPPTQINCPKIQVRKKYIESFEVKCQYWTSSWKQFRKKNRIKNQKLLFFLLQQSLNPSCWPQNAPSKNRARSNYLTRSLNRHQFLSINIDSKAS